MLRLRFTLLCIIPVLFTSCSTLNHLGQGKGPGKSANPFLLQTQIASAEKEALSAVCPMLLAAALFATAALITAAKASKRQKRLTQLDSQDLDLIGLAADTLGDLYRRINRKKRNNIIPFPLKE